jgi:NTP pyrophosphatase (non-canonical NTP hydrolase)
MNLNTIIQALRQRCPSFANRVAGAAEFKRLPENSTLPVPAAFVIPLDDEVDNNRSANGYRQNIRDVFAVVVMLSNTADERGQAAGTAVHDIRRELWRALLGWEPAEDYDGIEYEGGNLLGMDRARLFYQFEFAVDFEIGADEVGTPETWQTLELAALGTFNEVKVDVDFIDPAITLPGPDGRIDASFVVEVPQT